MAHELTAAAGAAPFHLLTQTGTVAGVQQPLADARSLHATLGSARQFADWIKDRIDQHLLIEGEDFLEDSHNSVKNPGGRPRTDYLLTLDTAKHLALAERTARGREVRQYFIEFERRVREQGAPLVAQMQAQIQELLAEKAQRVLADNPRLRYALRVHGLQGLNQTERARLMGQKSADSWRTTLKELAALGLVQYQPSEGRQAAGLAMQGNLWRGKQGPSPAQQAARLANAHKMRQALAAKKGQAPQRAAAQEGGAA